MNAEGVTEDQRAIAVHLRDALIAVLEVRPEDPLLYLSAYFRKCQGQNSPALASYFIRACPRSRPNFKENLYSAFSTLAARQDTADREGSGARVAECGEVVRHLCRSLPAEVTRDLEAHLPRGPLVGFSEFAAVVEACLAADESMRATLALFQRLDSRDVVHMPREELLAALHQHQTLQQQQPEEQQELSSASPHVVNHQSSPPLESLRMELESVLQGEADATAEDLFVALWRARRRGAVSSSDMKTICSSGPFRPSSQRAQ